MNRPKRILVTGADGFIGSHLVETLLMQGYPVRAFVFYNSFNSIGWLNEIAPSLREKLEIISGDIRDSMRVREAVKDSDWVFHLAALIAIPYSYSAPESYVDTNIRGTLNVLQACRESGTKRVLVTSTSEVYGTARFVPITEEHPFQGQSPYSASKIGADRLAESYFKSFDLPVSIVRPFNTYGPRQSPRAIIPTVITQLLAGRDEISVGNLTPTRDLNFVSDICRGFVEIAKSDATIGEEINIGTGTEISMKDLVETLVSAIRPQTRIKTDQTRMRPEKSEVDRLLACNKKIKRLTSWTPQVSLEDGLKQTIDWFQRRTGRYQTDIYHI